MSRFWDLWIKVLLKVLSGKQRGESMKESKFQSDLIKDLKNRMPGCIVHKNDGSNVEQGFPDLTVIFKGRAGFLECKRNKTANKRPNQDRWIERLNDSGAYASFIYPENRKEVLDELEQTLGT